MTWVSSFFYNPHRTFYRLLSRKPHVPHPRTGKLPVAILDLLRMPLKPVLASAKNRFTFSQKSGDALTKVLAHIGLYGEIVALDCAALHLQAANRFLGYS